MYLLEREWAIAERKRETVLIGEEGGIAEGKNERYVFIGEREWTTAEGKRERYVFIGGGVGHIRRKEGTLCIDWRGSGP